MRIAFLGDGSLNHIQRWAGYFHKKGDEIVLFSFEDVKGCQFPTVLLPRYLPTKLAGYLSALPILRKKLREFRPDIVNALYAGGYGFLASLTGYRPLVVSTLGSDLLVDYPSSVIHRIQIRHAIRRADLVTTDAETLSEAAIEAGASREKIRKIFFGIEESVFHPVSGNKENNSEEIHPLNIITTRNFYDIYNIGLLVEAAPLILEKTDAVFTVCGDGPLRKALEKEIAKIGLKERFIFTGKLSQGEIAKHLRRADVYVSTSLSDSTSVSLLEAMACGVLPVVTDIPANREWIEEGKNGFLVPADSPAQLADAIVEITVNREQAGRFIRNNLSVISERGLWESNMKRLEKAFDLLLEKKES